MRSIGTHRGNPLLRASVLQTARRRMEWLPDVQPGVEPIEREGLRATFLTRAFFDRVREHVLPRMAPTLCVDGAELRYFGAHGLALWGLQAEQGLVLAYECADTPTQLIERARRWLSCLRTRTTPGVLDRTWGKPVYGARVDEACDRVEVVWANPGEWCGFVLADDPAPRQWNLPPNWSEPEFARS